jgi:MSHA biogenesis protein MshJ
MKRWWKTLSARIDALSLRERGFLFVTLLVCCLLLADVLWLSPVQTLHRQITQKFTAQNAELQRLHDQLKSSSSETGPGRVMREELVQIKARLEAVNQEISQVPSSALDETPLSKVLVHFLRRHEGLSLVRTATLPADNKAAQESSAAGLKRQGLELTVAGPYPELIRYVQTLERSLPALRWGAMKVVSDKQPVQLTLQVSLVGVSP